jgi:hypothetical protein
MGNQSIAQNDISLPVAIGEPIPPLGFYKFKKRSILNAGGWLIKVKCPFCQKEHIHGWSPATDDATRVWTRKSHCRFGDQYRIVIINGGQE